IRKRLIENQRIDISPFENRYYKPRQYTLPTRQDKIQKKSGIYRLYLYYCYKLGYLPKYKKQNVSRLHYYLKEDLMKIDKISMETKLLARENISAIEQLFSYKNSFEKEIDSLIDIRGSLRKNVRKNADETAISKMKEKISDLSRKIRKLRNEITL